jgi:serine/threonine-protein kinase
MAEGRRRFRFLKELAQGGFGKVYLAEMLTGENFSSVVAIKILHARWAENAEVVMRSRDEARLLGRLRHRSIVRVEGLTRIQQQVAIVMEYLEGADLKAIMNALRDQGRPFPRQAAFEITGAIASALDAAYNQVPLSANEPLRVIHRDIKPSNAMLTVEGDVKVLDFGTARASFEHREAKTQALAFGSAAYMSPERLMGEDDTPSADVFSLGITLYELLTLESFGKIPVRYEKFERTVEERIDGLDLTALPEPVRAPARDTLRKLLAYEPGNRPSAAMVVELMERLAEECRDGGLKRFSREFVRDVMAREAVEADPHDPFNGMEFFEDTGTLPDGTALARNDAWTTETDRSDVIQRDLPDVSAIVPEPPAPLPEPPPSLLAQAPSMPDDFPMPEDEPATVMARNPFHELGEAAPRAPAAPYARSRTIVAEDPQEPTVLTPSPSGLPPAWGPPPPPVGTPPQGASPEFPVGGYRTPGDVTPSPGRGLGILVGALTLLGGAAALAWFMLRSDPAPAPAQPTEAAAAPDLRPGESEPNLAAPQAGRGNLVLRVPVPVKSVTVSGPEAPVRWSGTGVLNLRDLPPGKVRATVAPAVGSEMLGGDVRVTADKTCSWVLTDGKWVEGEESCR